MDTVHPPVLFQKMIRKCLKVTVIWRQKQFIEKRTRDLRRQASVTAPIYFDETGRADNLDKFSKYMLK